MVVGPREKLAKTTIHLDTVNWLGDADVNTQGKTMPILARIRSTTQPQEAELTLLDNGKAKVELATPEEGVSPGQACVFYGSDSLAGRVLGGGWIVDR